MLRFIFTEEMSSIHFFSFLIINSANGWSRNPVSKCFSGRKNLDCRAREHQVCCLLLRRRPGSGFYPAAGSGSSPRQFPHFPAKDEVPRDRDESDYDDIITQGQMI